MLSVPSLGLKARFFAPYSGPLVLPFQSFFFVRKCDMCLQLSNFISFLPVCKMIEDPNFSFYSVLSLHLADQAGSGSVCITLTKFLWSLVNYIGVHFIWQSYTHKHLQDSIFSTFGLSWGCENKAQLFNWMVLWVTTSYLSEVLTEDFIITFMALFLNHNFLA